LSKNIIASIRQNPQLHGSLLLAAIELAHRANGHSGTVFMSYSLLAAKCHQSRRTAIRHVHRLLDLGIIRCQRFWGPNRKWGINCYRFLICWVKPRPAHKRSDDILAPIFPSLKEEEKNGSLQDLERGKEKVLGWLTEGSQLWNMVNG
jgi:hypothetical protein